MQVTSTNTLKHAYTGTQAHTHSGSNAYLQFVTDAA